MVQQTSPGRGDVESIVEHDTYAWSWHVRWGNRGLTFASCIPVLASWRMHDAHPVIHDLDLHHKIGSRVAMMVHTIWEREKYIKHINTGKQHPHYSKASRTFIKYQTYTYAYMTQGVQFIEAKILRYRWHTCCQNAVTVPPPNSWRYSTHQIVHRSLH